MKRIIICFILAFITIYYVTAQNDVTKFLGIPIDGYKTEMIQKLKDKGFRSSKYDKDILTGEFNGHNVNVHIGTNNNKVYRIMLCDVNDVDERSIRIRFNNLCSQFENNPRYIPALLSPKDQRIPEDDDISYEMTVNKKRYEACFTQTGGIDAMKESFGDMLKGQYTDEEWNNPSEELQEKLNNLALFLCSKKSVWFMIAEHRGRYYITMYYDNENNRSNGEDL